MGLEARCKVTFAGREGEGIVQLETAHLAFKGPFRLKVPFSEIRDYQAREGVLLLETEQGPLALHLGSRLAERWFLKLRYPKTLIDKLGVKQDQVVSVIGVQDEEFWKFLRQRTDAIAAGEPQRDSDYLFLQVASSSELAQLPDLETFIKRNGAIWVVWPKGQKEIKEGDVRSASQAAHLVDVKVVSFSERLSALKLMVPVARR